MSFLADALWADLKHGVLARSRAAHDECEALHAANKVDALVTRATDAFALREDNFKAAAEVVFAAAKRPERRREYETAIAGRHADFVNWLYDLILVDAPSLANSRFFLDPPHPDRVWVTRQGAWDLAWRRAGEWKLKSLREVRASALPPAETLLVVRVGGKERPNPRLPP